MRNSADLRVVPIHVYSKYDTKGSMSAGKVGRREAQAAGIFSAGRKGRAPIVRKDLRIGEPMMWYSGTGSNSLNFLKIVCLIESNTHGL